MYSLESRAQEPTCLCPDPDFNVVIDPGTFPNGATLTQLQGAFPFFQGNTMINTCLSIQRRLIIDKNFTIEEGEVIMGPGSEVLLWGNVSLTFRDVNENGGVHGCTALWRGIRPRDNNGIVRINFFNSIVQDARHAIRANKQSIITAESTEFRNNHIGILLPNLGGGPPSPFNWSTTALRGNLFWTNGQYLPAFPNMHLDPIPIPTTVQNQSLPGIGIFVHNMSLGVTIGNVNDAPSLQLPALEIERQYIEDDLEAVALAIALILEELEADRLAQIQDLQTANAAITPANNPGHYLKSVNGIYLAHAADHSEWTTAERLTLDSIALLCPSEGGDAVYIARAMLGQLHGDECMELPAAFQAPVPPVHTTLEEPLAGIYPNPGHNEFFLNVPVTQSGQAEFRLYSLTGKQVLRVTMSAGERSLINLSSLATGLYLYDIWGDGRRLMNGKLSKINN